MKRVDLILLFLCLCSCKGNFPTEQMAYEKLLSRQIEKDRNLFELVDFKQTNGMESNVLGEDIYQITYHVKKMAKVNLHEAHGMGKSYFVTDSSVAVDSAAFDRMKGGSHIERPSYTKAYKKGELIKELEGKIRFVKIGNDWQ